MTFGTVIEIIVAVFAVFGLYTVTKMLAYVLAYDKKVRRSVTIAVQISPDDDEELREIKRMCAKQASYYIFGRASYIIIENDKE